MRFCFAVGAGHAPPATVCYNEYYGYSVGRGLDPSLPFCGCRPFARRGEVTPPYGAIKKHRAVGAGHAPPATVYCNEYNGLIRRGGIYAARCSHPGKSTYRANHPDGFPLWGKLSPQVTDEGATSGHFPLIRRAGAPPSPQGEGFCSNYKSYTKITLKIFKNAV